MPSLSQSRLRSTRSSEVTAFIVLFHQGICVHITTLRAKLDALPEDRRKRVDELVDALIAEDMTLRDRRKVRNRTLTPVGEQTPLPVDPTD